MTTPTSTSRVKWHVHDRCRCWFVLAENSRVEGPVTLGIAFVMDTINCEFCDLGQIAILNTAKIVGHAYLKVKPVLT